MAKASPAANSPAAGTGQTWFKVWEDAPVYKNGALVFPSQSASYHCRPSSGTDTRIKISSYGLLHLYCSEEFAEWAIPNPCGAGKHNAMDQVQKASLIRAKIALHSASTFGGAQFYISCAQVNIVNGGNGNPSPLVSIPGVYTGVRIASFSSFRSPLSSHDCYKREPGILINIYSLPANYPGYQSRKTIMFFVLPVIYLFVLYQLVLQFGEDEKVVCCSDHGDLALLHYMSYDVSYLAFSN